jgi:hypothetical protein
MKRQLVSKDEDHEIEDASRTPQRGGLANAERDLAIATAWNGSRTKPETLYSRADWKSHKNRLGYDDVIDAKGRLVATVSVMDLAVSEMFQASYLDGGVPKVYCSSSKPTVVGRSLSRHPGLRRRRSWRRSSASARCLAEHSFLTRTTSRSGSKPATGAKRNGCARA